MTTPNIQHQVRIVGHVVSLTGEAAPAGKLRAALQVEVAMCEPFNLTIKVPTADAMHWLPGTTFTMVIEPHDLPREGT